MRQRIDRRRREQFEKFTRALGEVSPTHFMQDALKAGASSLDLQLFGAIPPITEARRLDTGGKAAIVQSERQAARTLIQKSKQESLNSKQAVVNEARQIRSAQWRLQSLRPPSMDSTRDGSFARSPWSDQSDWASSNGPTPRDIGRSSSAGTQITTRTHSPMPGVPLGKAFEDMLANYYRTLEEIQDQEFAEAQKARQEESEQLQREHVRREFTSCTAASGAASSTPRARCWWSTAWPRSSDASDSSCTCDRKRPRINGKRVDNEGPGMSRISISF